MRDLILALACAAQVATTALAVHARKTCPEGIRSWGTSYATTVSSVGRALTPTWTSMSVATSGECDH